ncbi:hypothetical protein BKA65DRAFT_556872 [Rhexocercosporidium sp. MPI-PUGE-AT-0058]|nr:hypothetical protein BKA65DRAFT_556872 [Rhexocercosporidium sp. MPI-PUGE-AT-0058]
MAAPPPKKQKTTNTNTKEPKPKPPIIFNTLRYELDVRLQVFDQEFQLSSVPLKLYSAFFRKFLDSPDKATAIEDNASALAGPDAVSRARAGGPHKFLYHWVTVVDGEKSESWHLVACNPQNEQSNVSNYSGNKSKQLSAFSIILSAIHTLPYSITDSHQLTTITELADYYRALPIVSCSLDAALYKSPGPLSEISDCSDVITAASKLRNKLLFKASLIYLVGEWNFGDGDFSVVKDRKLQKLARKVWAEVAVKVARAFHAITNAVDNENLHGISKRGAILGVTFTQELKASNRDHDESFSLPKYLLQISRAGSTDRTWRKLWQIC